MKGLFAVLSVIFFLCLVVGLIRPIFFQWLFRKYARRLVIVPTFVILMTGSLVVAALLWANDNNSNQTTNTNTNGKPAVKEMKNWSGYLKYGQQDTMTSVSGDWIVPTVQPGLKIQTASNWIGIGGYATTGLIQIATQSMAGKSNNAAGTLYDAVWECLPAPPTLIPDFKVNAGDKISASIKKTDAGWAMSLKNNNTGQTFEKTVACTTDGSTAEWILENPPIGVEASFKSDIMPTFSPTTFSNLLVNGSAPDQSNMIEFNLTNNGQLIASPNHSLSQNGQEFTVTDARK